MNTTTNIEAIGTEEQAFPVDLRDALHKIAIDESILIRKRELHSDVRLFDIHCRTIFFKTGGTLEKCLDDLYNFLENRG